MKLEDLLTSVDLIDEKIVKNFGEHSNTKRERILARTVKLGEEFGELCSEVMASMGDQRKEKLDRREIDNLEDELADVIVTTLLLAKTMEIDIGKVLEKKIERIKNRYK